MATGALVFPDGPWAVWEIDPELRAAAVVRLESGRSVRERSEWGAAAGWRAAGRPGLEAPPLSKSALRRLARCAGNARWAGLAPVATMRRLGEALVAAGAEPVEEPAISLASLALAVIGPPRAKSLEDLGGRLGVRIVESEDPMDRAREAAECLLRMLELSARPSRTECTAGACLEPASSARLWRREDAHSEHGSTRPVPRAFDAAFLRSLPDAPGVYRFFSEDGTLLYVGKAANLRRRVGSYFHRRVSAEARTAAWIGLVHRIEIEGTGSEAEALMREADAIARDLPPANRQRQVHERRARAAESLVLLLPAAGSRAVNAHLIRGRVLLARITLGPRGGGNRRFLELLRRTYFETRGTGQGEPGNPYGAESAAAPTIASRAKGGRPTAHRDAAILLSWLARQTQPAAAFDPTDAATPEDALNLALRYAVSVRRGETGVVYRS